MCVHVCVLLAVSGAPRYTSQADWSRRSIFQSCWCSVKKKIQKFKNIFSQLEEAKYFEKKHSVLSKNINEAMHWQFFPLKNKKTKHLRRQCPISWLIEVNFPYKPCTFKFFLVS
jgi:hypothetical protein